MVTVQNKQLIKVSIIIIHYKAHKEFFDCLYSLKKNKPQISFETIVVENDLENPVEKKLKRNYPSIKYVKSPANIGFGPGNNLGAKYAKGEYLFFLNPDTYVFPNTVDALVKFLDKKKSAAAVAPLLLYEDKTPFDLQGNTILTPLKAMIALSFLNKLFPNNPISKKYWMLGWEKTKVKEIDVAPGTALMIRRKIYESMGGFDDKIFLYFEEFDLCKRIRELNYKIFITPDSKLIHLWGRSTQDKKRFNPIFRRSRFYYFRKHYGLFSALLVEAFTRFGKKELLILILVLGLCLIIYRLD